MGIEEKLKSKLEVEFGYVNAIKIGVSYGLNPLEIVAKAYEFQKESPSQEKYEKLKYCTKMLQEWYKSQ